MSCYNQQRIHGKLKLADIRTLREKLVVAYNKDMQDNFSKVKAFKKDIPVANSRTSVFKLIACVKESNGKKPSYWTYSPATIQLNMKTGEFIAETDYNNHTVEEVYEFRTWKVLVYFLENLKETKAGTTYGAESRYYDEYMAETMSGPDISYYGDWKPKALRRINQKPNYSYHKPYGCR